MPLIILDDPDSTLSMLRESVAGMAARTDPAAVMRRRRSAGADLDAEVWQEMAQAGWLGLSLPEDLGGAGLGMAELAVLSESLGRALVTEPFAMLSVFPGALLAALEPSDTVRDLAEGIASGARIVPVLWQDARGRCQPLQLSPEGVLGGEAHLVSGGTSATAFLVLAQQGDTRVLLRVRAGGEGVRVHQRPGIDAATLSNVAFQGVAVAAGDILAQGPAVEGAFDHAIRMTRLALAAELAGLGARALELTVDYTRERVQFGKSIASFQAIQHRLVDMWADSEFACAAVANAVEAGKNGPGPALSLAVLAAKARAGEAATSITRRAVHLHGAMGFTDQSNIGLYLKRAIALNATLGQPEEMRLAFLDAESAT